MPTKVNITLVIILLFGFARPCAIPTRSRPDGVHSHDGTRAWTGLPFIDDGITRVVNENVPAVAPRRDQLQDPQTPRPPCAKRTPPSKEADFAAGLYRVILRLILSRVINGSLPENEP
ncbi:MAG: hypothetical protein AB1714_21345 [Acidobacteriota bacterium]